MVPRMLTVLILLVTTFPIAAQEEAAAIAAERRAAVQRLAQNRVSPETEVFDVAFSGGTLGELFAVITEQNDRPTNVVLAKEAKDIPVPPLQLTGVSMGSLTVTLKSICPGLHMTFSGNIFALGKNKEEVYVNIYNIQHLVDNEDKTLCYFLEDIATTIQTAWQMYDNRQAPEMKIHEGTFLVIVQGTQNEHRIVGSVLESLVPDSRQVNSLLNLQSKVHESQSQIRNLVNQLSDLSKKMNELEMRKAALEAPVEVSPVSK